MKTETDEQLPLPRKALRTVTPPYRGRRDVEMDVIGWAIFLGLIVLLLPMLPVLVGVLIIVKVIEIVDRRRRR